MNISIKFKEDNHLGNHSGNLFTYVNGKNLQINAKWVYFELGGLPRCFKLKYIESVKITL